MCSTRVEKTNGSLDPPLKANKIWGGGGHTEAGSLAGPPTLAAPEVERGPDSFGTANKEGGTDSTRTLKHICVQSLRTPQPVPLQDWCFVIPMSSLLALSSTATSSGRLSNSLSENWPVCFCLVFPCRAEPREDRVLPSPPTSHTVWVWLRAHNSQVLCHRL